MLRHQQREIRVFRLPLLILEAVAVDGNDPVGVLVDHDAVGVHAEGADIVLEFFRAVYDLALIQLVGDMGEDHRGQLHADAKIHAVGAGRDFQVPADRLHPLAPASSDGDDHLLRRLLPALEADEVAALGLLDLIDPRIEAEFHLVLQFREQVLQDHVVDVRPEMPDRRLQKKQLVLHAELLQVRSRGGIKLCAGAAVGHVDLIHIVHELQGRLTADILIQRPAEIVGNIVFSVGERAGAAETVHDGTGLAADAALHLFPVDGTFPLFQRVPRVKHQNLQFRRVLHQFVCGVDPPGTCTDNDHIIF